MSQESATKFATGDLLRRPINDAADHYGVYVGRRAGVELVFEGNTDPEQPDRGLYQLVTLAEFSRGRTVTAVPVPKDSLPAIGARIKQCLAERTFRYSAVGGEAGWNCEEVARHVVTGTRDCRQTAAAAKSRPWQWLMVSGLLATAVGAAGAAATYLREKENVREEEKRTP